MQQSNRAPEHAVDTKTFAPAQKPAASAHEPAEYSFPTKDLESDTPQPGETLSIATWNVMGLTAVKEDLRHLLEHRRTGSSIDIMVLTESAAWSLEERARPVVT